MIVEKGNRYLSMERIDVGLRSEPDKACRRVTGSLEAGFGARVGGRVNALFADGLIVFPLLRTGFRKTRCAIGVAARYSPSAQGCRYRCMSLRQCPKPNVAVHAMQKQGTTELGPVWKQRSRFAEPWRLCVQSTNPGQACYCILPPTVYKV